MSSESDIRKLLKMRADLEERTENLQTEIEDLKLVMVEIDKAIVKQGFHQPSPVFQAMKPAELKPEEDKQPVTVTLETTADGSSIQAKDGTVLGRVKVDNDIIVFTPREGLTFMTSTPPFQSFLLDRVLANMRTSDETRASTGEITLEQVLSYEVEADGEAIKTLIVHNYGGERRLREIQSSLRWSLDKMYDKMRRG
jgi:ribosomal protein L11